MVDLFPLHAVAVLTAIRVLFLTWEAVFRTRPYDKVIEEMAGIDNNRLFIVDNSLAQDKEWEIQLFKEIIPLKRSGSAILLKTTPKSWTWLHKRCLVCVSNRFDTSDYIKERIKGTTTMELA